MLLNISSESIHSLLPFFIKVFSGMISNYLGQRKGLPLLGCAGGRGHASGNAGGGNGYHRGISWSISGRKLNAVAGQ